MLLPVACTYKAQDEASGNGSAGKVDGEDISQSNRRNLSVLVLNGMIQSINPFRPTLLLYLLSYLLALSIPLPPQLASGSVQPVTATACCGSHRQG